MGNLTLDRFPPCNQIIEKNNDGDDEEEMNQTPCHLEDHPPKEPGNDQDDGEPNHGISSRER